MGKEEKHGNKHNYTTALWVTVPFFKAVLTNKAICVFLFPRSHSFLNCASPSNSGSTVGGLLFDGQQNDSLLDSLVDPPSLPGLCLPMQVQPARKMYCQETY